MKHGDQERRKMLRRSVIVFNLAIACFPQFTLADNWNGPGTDFLDVSNWWAYGGETTTTGAANGASLYMGPVGDSVDAITHWADGSTTESKTFTWQIPSQSNPVLSSSLAPLSLWMETYDHANTLTVNNGSTLAVGGAGNGGLVIGGQTEFSSSLFPQWGNFTYPAQTYLPATLDVTGGSTLISSTATSLGYNLPGILTVEGGSSATLANFTAANTSSGSATINVEANSSVSFTGSFSLGSGQFTLNNGGSIGLPMISSHTVINNKIGGQLTLSGSATIVNSSTLTNAGTVLVPNGVTLGISAALNNSGGTIAPATGGTVTINGTVTGGTLAGTGTINLSGILQNLTNTTTATVAAGYDGEIQGPIINSGSIVILANQAKLIANSSGTTTLSGGGMVTLTDSQSSALQTASGGTLVNVDNLIHGSGSVIAGGGNIINQGTISADVSGQALTLNNGSYGYVFANQGTLTASGGGTLVISCPLNNSGGTIAPATGGTVTINGTVTGGTLAGTGTINLGATLQDLTNATTVTIPVGYDGELQGSIVNSGSFVVLGNHAALLAYSSNTTTLSGGGTVTLTDPQTSLLQTVNGGTLVNADNLIHGSGTIVASSGNIVNNGTIAADASGQTLTLSNSGSYSFTNTGTLTASNGGALTISTPVNNSGGTIYAAAGGTVYLYGATTGGNLTVAPSGSLTITGTYQQFNGSTFSTAGTAYLPSFVNAGGEALFGGSQQWTSRAVFNNSTGSASFSTDPGSASSAPLSVIVSGGQVTFSATSHLASLNISSGGTAIVSAQGQPHAVLITSTFFNTGLVDLTCCNLDLPNQSLANISREVGQGCANGTWTGNSGITSSSAAADSSHLTALGVIQNNQAGLPIFTGADLFEGVAPGAEDVLVKYTYYGDANLDGKVDGSDYSRLDNGFLNHLTGWFNGDFNYDGTVDGSDYTLIDNAFNTQGAQFSAHVAEATAQIAAPTVVPEPAGVGLIALGASLALRRRLQMPQRVWPMKLICER